MKYVPAGESGGSKAFICRIISDGFMSPISGNLCSSNALAQRSMVYLDISMPSAARRRPRRSRRSPPGCR
jgi:hypothetical protein